VTNLRSIISLKRLPHSEKHEKDMSRNRGAQAVEDNKELHIHKALSMKKYECKPKAVSDVGTGIKVDSLWKQDEKFSLYFLELIFSLTWGSGVRILLFVSAFTHNTSSTSFVKGQWN